MAGVLGPIALAVGAGALAWNHYNEGLEEAEDKMKRAAAAAEAMATAVGGFKSAQARAELELLVATGLENVEVLDKAKAADQAATAVAATKKAMADELAAAEAKLADVLERQTKATKSSEFWTNRAGASAWKFSKEIRNATVAVAKKKELIDGVKDAEKKLADTLYATTKAQKENAKSTRSGTKSTEKQTDAIADLIEETAKLIPPEARTELEAFSDQLDTLYDAVVAGGDAVESRLAPSIERLEAAYDKADSQAQADALAKMTEEAQKFSGSVTKIGQGAEVLAKLEKASAQSAEAFTTLSPEIDKVKAKLIELETLAAPIELDESGTLKANRANVQALIAEKARLSQAQAAYSDLYGQTSDAITAKQDATEAQLAESWARVGASIAAAFDQAMASAGQFADAGAQFASLQTDAIVKESKRQQEERAEVAEALEADLAAIEKAIATTKDEATLKALRAKKAAKESEIATELAKAEEMKEIKNREIQEAFKLQQALQATSAIMSTAAAIVMALAQLGPVAGAVAAAAITATGAAQVATIYAQESPSLHLGGMIGSGNTTPDEQMVKARKGEAILTAQGVDAIGGAAGVSAANQGRGASGEIVVNQVYRHKILDTLVSETIKRGGSVSQAINKRNRRGRRNPYRRAS